MLLSKSRIYEKNLFSGFYEPEIIDEDFFIEYIENKYVKKIIFSYDDTFCREIVKLILEISISENYIVLIDMLNCYGHLDQRLINYALSLAINKSHLNLIYYFFDKEAESCPMVLEAIICSCSKNKVVKKVIELECGKEKIKQHSDLTAETFSIILIKINEI